MRVARGLGAAVGATGVASLVGLAACAQLLGVEDVQQKDAGTDVTMDAHRNDAGTDARMDARADATQPHDAGVDVSARETGPDVAPGSTRCLPNGRGMETFERDGGWIPSACSGLKPVCIGSQCQCEPGETYCDGQTFNRCILSPGATDGGLDGGPPTWATAQDCPGGCTLAGCGPVPPSCTPVVPVSTTADGVSTCPSGAGSCCLSNEIPAGSYRFDFDGITSVVSFPPTSVSGFRLDDFEVTVGRFREFVTALTTDAGAWLPEPGSGKHSHLNGGQGLAIEPIDSAAFESGWEPAWNSDLMALRSSAKSSNSPLFCADLATWTNNADTNESQPINCITWVEAYAFCIWDGGFLPSEAEWNYAAAGGDDQRYYPWSPSYATQRTLDHYDVDAGCKNANFTPGSPCLAATEPVGSVPDGGARWAQSDMGGNVVEWVLDVYSPNSVPSCDNCALLTAPDGGDAAVRGQRGGSFVSDSNGIRGAFRGRSPAFERSPVAGVRCARVP